jgi:hypothetical protein
MATISARCKSSWAIETFAPPWSIRTS